MKLISQDISFPQKTPNLAVYEAVGYSSASGTNMVRIRYEELKDDIYDRYLIEHSPDNGSTWQSPQHWEAGDEVSGGVLRRLFLHGPLIEPSTGNVMIMGMEGALANDSALDGMTQYYPIFRTSTDAGQTWSDVRRAVQTGNSFDERHPFDGIWIGKNSLMPANAPLALDSGRILIPCNMTILGEDDTYYRPPGAYTFTVGAVMIGKASNAGEVEWSIGEPVQIPAEQSSRGAIEPTLVNVDDGRILMVLRANTGLTDKQSGRKWYSVSNDEGQTWSPPERWSYSSGKPFYSPSSISVLMRHSSGRILWFGNICEEPPRGNLPRYPLVAGFVDEKSLMLEPETLMTVDTRRDGDSEGLQLSNFCVYEDRTTTEVVLHMTRWDGSASGGDNPIDASVHRYRIEV